MRLYLNADSKNNIGYTPDWLKVTYKEQELTLDVRGDIDYDTDCLNCRCKRELIPWVLYDFIDGDEIDLSELSDEEIDEMFPVKKIVEFLQNGSNFRIGVYPANDSQENMKLAKDDVLTGCAGFLDIYDGVNDIHINFEFEAEFYG